MERLETAPTPVLLPARVGQPALETVLILSREIAPFPASGVILALAGSRADSHPHRYDHLKLRYDQLLKRLAQLRRRLKPSSAPEEDALDEPPSEPVSPKVTYPTLLGSLSFAELMERTRKYAAFALRSTYEVCEADLDDGLQAGYVKLWQRLQQEPELLEDKAMAWIGKGIIFTALHATRGDWQFRRHTQGNGVAVLEAAPNVSTSSFAPHSRESRQTDVRADIHQAIGSVAERILRDEQGRGQNHALWALYGLTMLQVSASETSRLFRVREQTMQVAYQRVRGWLQEALPGYAPKGETRTVRQHGRKALPEQDMKAIREANKMVPEAVYEAVQRLIEETNADTRQQDEVALAGIRAGIPALAQARSHTIPVWRMQRAYTRVNLMIAAQNDPSVRMKRPERRVKPVFTLTPESEIAVEQLALELLKQPKSYEKLVALHAHISNLAISTTAKHFDIPTSTLRYYAQQIGVALGTPTKPVHEG